MTRDAKRARDRHAASVRRYHERVMREVLEGERPYNSIPRVNKKRRAKRAAADEVYGSYHKRMASLPCLVACPECYGPVAGHHVKSVGAGGKDHGNTVPLCALHHTELHATGADAFEWRYGVSLVAEAAWLATQGAA